MEKGGLSLVFAVKKFRSYLLPRPFFFLTSQPALQFLVRKPNPAGKFAKWICELQEFSFTFITESTSRASLADLLTNKEEEEETNVKEELCEELETPPTAFKLHFDGAFSHSTKSRAGGIILFDPEGKELWARGRQFPEAISNNVAEYNALICGLEDCLKEGVKEVEVKGDSQLVIRQMNGVYKARSPNLQDLYKRAMELKEAFESGKFVHFKEMKIKRLMN